MRLVARRLTGNDGTEEDWIRSRFAAAAQECAGRRIGATDGARNAVAACAVTLWAWESGYGDGSPGTTGEGESNFNLGSVTCAPSYDGDCVVVGTHTLRAYPTLAAGAAGWFGVVQATYPAAWTLLVVGDLSYWSVLMSQGYGGNATADQALSVHSRVCRVAGVADMDDAERAQVRAAWDSPGMGAGDDGGGDGGGDEGARAGSVFNLALVVGGAWGLGRAFRVW